jgi:hypothetical protein
MQEDISVLSELRDSQRLLDCQRLMSEALNIYLVASAAIPPGQHVNCNR